MIYWKRKCEVRLDVYTVEWETVDQKLMGESAYQQNLPLNKGTEPARVELQRLLGLMISHKFGGESSRDGV